MQSSLITDIITEIAKALGGNEAAVRANSKCLSSDVTATYDPNYADVYEHRNSSLLGCGVSMCKYTGSGGKGGSNDATAEYVAELRNIFDNNEIKYQMAELGKVDQGGGGTIAFITAEYPMDVIDLGIPLHNMHAPWEVAAKSDIFEAYRAYKVFLTNI